MASLRARPQWLLYPAGILVAAVAAACSAAGDDSSAAGGSYPGNYGGTTSGGVGTPTMTVPASTASEQEVESTYGAPVSTGRYVWIPNPASGRVAYIDAESLSVKLVDAGDGPTYIAAVPDAKDDVAIVLNVRSLDATLLRASTTGLTATSFPVSSSGNSWAISTDGRWAIAWTDARQITKLDPIQGYQDLTVIDLKAPTKAPTALTVGYRPVAIHFDATSSRAYAVTQDGITVITLGDTAAVTKNIPISDSPTTSGSTTDVAITPDGAYALVRVDGASAISSFSLNDGTKTKIPLPDIATDLDLSPDGKTAIAVMRNIGKAALIAIPSELTTKTPPLFAVGDDLTTLTADAGTDASADAAADTGSGPKRIVGSVTLTPKSTVGFFYTNAIPSNVLTTMDIAAVSPTPTSILLRAPVLGVIPTDDATSAIVLHDHLTEAGSSYPAAVSLVPVSLGLPPKPVPIDAKILSVAVAHAGDHALIAAGDDTTQVYRLYIASLPSQQVQKLSLASLPIQAGIIESQNQGFVAQKHPDGRITFVNLETGVARTITGFELATQVVDGTK